MLRIRLTRTGKKHAPSYRIIVTEKRSKRDGKYLDLLGHWNPSHTPELLDIDREKLNQWQSQGAQISAAVKTLLEKKIQK